MLWSVPAQNALLFAGYGAGLGWCSRGEVGGQQGVSPSLWHVFVGGCAGGFAQVSGFVFYVRLLVVYDIASVELPATAVSHEIDRNCCVQRIYRQIDPEVLHNQ